LCVVLEKNNNNNKLLQKYTRHDDAMRRIRALYSWRSHAFLNFPFCGLIILDGINYHDSFGQVLPKEGQAFADVVGVK
jgi:hypothetical protein